MKEILAIIRMNRINQTKHALTEAGINSFHARECLGRGQGVIDFKILRGAELGYEEAIAQLGNNQRLIPKRMLSIVVNDNAVPLVIETIITANQTGKNGDGKIFVLPINEALMIRTGESGADALDII